LIHERVPADRHGRAFAAYNGLRNSAELDRARGRAACSSRRWARAERS
jgi:hypothetical protein